MKTEQLCKLNVIVAPSINILRKIIELNVKKYDFHGRIYMNVKKILHFVEDLKNYKFSLQINHFGKNLCVD